MIKLDIINEVVNRTGITKTKAEMAVETVFESMKKALEQGDRIEHSDATYAVTEILIVGVKTPGGVLRMRPNVAYALLRLNETPV